MPDLNWMSRPSSMPVHRGIDIERCNRKNNFRLCFLSISPDIHGLEIHFAGRSQPCTMHEGFCPYCQERREKRWVGYLAALTIDRSRTYLAELTPAVVPTIVAILKQRETLRGSILTLERPSNRDTGRLKLSVSPQPPDMEKLPPEPPVEEFLKHIYGPNVKSRGGTPGEIIISASRTQSSRSSASKSKATSDPSPRTQTSNRESSPTPKAASDTKPPPLELPNGPISVSQLLNGNHGHLPKEQPGNGSPKPSPSP